MTVRRRRRDLGVLRTLGFSAGQMRSSVSVQAAALVAIASAIGTVLGVVAGRAVWSLVADGVGVRSEPLVPWAVALLPIGVLVLSQAIALFPARAVSRLRPAVVLRAE